MRDLIKASLLIGLRKVLRKPTTGQDSNPQPLRWEACALLLCYNCCPQKLIKIKQTILQKMKTINVNYLVSVNDTDCSLRAISEILYLSKAFNCIQVASYFFEVTHHTLGSVSANWRNAVFLVLLMLCCY